MSRSHGKRHSVKFALLLLSTAVAMALLESGTRVFLPQYIPTSPIPFYSLANGARLGPPATVWRLWRKDGEFDVEVKFNRHGFRDRKDYTQCKPGDWFVVGDSFAFGYGVREEERFGDRLERQLSRPFYNIAIPTDLRGYGALVSHVEGSGIRISRLILSICMENDLHDYSLPLPALSRRLWPPPPSLTWPQRCKNFLFANSAAYAAIAATIHRHPFLHYWAERAGWIADIKPCVPLNDLEKMNGVVNSSAEVAFALAEGRKVLILLIPSRALWLGENREGERKLHDLFAEILRGRGVAVVDLKSQMEKEENPLRFWYREGHWNAAGHAFAAQALADALPLILSEEQ